MAIEYAIRDLILSDPAIVAIVGTRVYPAPLPANPVYPAITYQQISQGNVSSHSGNSHLANTRLQLTCWASSHTANSDLRDNLKRVLRDFHGNQSGYRLDRVAWDNDLAQYESETAKHQRIIDLLIAHDTVY
jgi:Protein of unknown function (DUF3168)